MRWIHCKTTGGQEVYRWDIAEVQIDESGILCGFAEGISEKYQWAKDPWTSVHQWDRRWDQ